MLSALLVDDEIDALEVLDIQLGRHCPDVTVRDSFVTAAGALEAISKRRYDIAFLDIHLQRGAEGLRLGEQLHGGHTRVVFVTAYERYALQAFRVRAFDYLLKPVEVSELKRVVTEVKQAIAQQIPSHRVTLKDQHRSLIVDEKDVHLLAGEGSYVSVYGADGPLIKMSVNLNTLEQLFRSSFFFRCHQSFTINLAQIKEILRLDQQTFVVLNNEMRVPVARRRKVELEAQLRDLRK